MDGVSVDSRMMIGCMEDGWMDVREILYGYMENE
jgi:hypothetical protein